MEQWLEIEKEEARERENCAEGAAKKPWLT
jgi:hypothetical protein